MKASLVGKIITQLFCLAIGLICLVPSIHQLCMYSMFRYRSVAVYGVIEHPSAGRDMGGRPLVRYVDHLGAVHEFKSRAKTHWFARPREGERIRVFYVKQQPQSAKVDSLFHYILFPLGIGAAGGYGCYRAVRDGWVGLKQRRTPKRE